MGGGASTAVSPDSQAAIAVLQKQAATATAAIAALRADVDALTYALKTSNAGGVIRAGPAPGPAASAAEPIAKKTDSKNDTEVTKPAVEAVVEAPELKPPSLTWSCKQHRTGKHDIFISYRVMTDKNTAQLLCLALEREKRPTDDPPAVFWDAQCLNDGEFWKDGFLNGLQLSTLFLPLVSLPALEGIKNNAAKQADNVLLEYELALQRYDKGQMAILPLLVGSRATRGTLTEFRMPAADYFPDAPHKASGLNIRATMAALFKLQGVRLDPENVKASLVPVLDFLEKFDPSGERAAMKLIPRYTEFSDRVRALAAGAGGAAVDFAKMGLTNAHAAAIAKAIKAGAAAATDSGGAGHPPTTSLDLSGNPGIGDPGLESLAAAAESTPVVAMILDGCTGSPASLALCRAATVANTLQPVLTAIRAGGGGPAYAAIGLGLTDRHVSALAAALMSEGCVSATLGQGVTAVLVSIDLRGNALSTAAVSALADAAKVAGALRRCELSFEHLWPKPPPALAVGDAVVLAVDKATGGFAMPLMGLTTFLPGDVAVITETKDEDSPVRGAPPTTMYIVPFGGVECPYTAAQLVRLAPAYLPGDDNDGASRHGELKAEVARLRKSLVANALAAVRARAVAGGALDLRWLGLRAEDAAGLGQALVAGGAGQPGCVTSLDMSFNPGFGVKGFVAVMEHVAPLGLLWQLACVGCDGVMGDEDDDDKSMAVIAAFVVALGGTAIAEAVNKDGRVSEDEMMPFVGYASALATRALNPLAGGYSLPTAQIEANLLKSMCNAGGATMELGRRRLMLFLESILAQAPALSAMPEAESMAIITQLFDGVSPFITADEKAEKWESLATLNDYGAEVLKRCMPNSAEAQEEGEGMRNAAVEARAKAKANTAIPGINVV